MVDQRSFVVDSVCALLDLYQAHPIITVVSVIIAFVTYKLLYQLYLYPRVLSPLRKIPGPPYGGILAGQFKNILAREAGTLQREWVLEYGPVVRAVGPIGIERLIFSRPEAIRQILTEDWFDYPRPKWMRDVLGLVAGFGLLTVTGNEHKQMRRAMNPAFSMSSLMAQMDIYHGPIETMIKLIRAQVEGTSGGKVMPVYQWMSKVTLDIICLSAFGYETDALNTPHNPLTVSYEALLERQDGRRLAGFIALVNIPGAAALLGSDLLYRFHNWIPDFAGDLRTLSKSMHNIKEISRKMMQQKIADAAVTSSEKTAGKKDIMSLLVNARLRDDGDGYQMNDRAMMDQVLTFLGAGHETTASGLAWTLWLLANDQSAQDRLRKEVTPLIDSNPRPDYRDIRDLTYLDCVVNESLRVMPPVPMTFREAGKSGFIEETYVPKGTILYVPIRVINTLPEIWGEDADEFKPERWLDLPKAYNSTYSMLSFLAGPHGCIGKTMAVIEMKTILAPLISNFKFSPAYAGQVAKPTAAVTMKPADDCPLIVTAIGKSTGS